MRTPEPLIAPTNGSAWATLAVVTVAVVAIYWRALDAPFIFDDVPGIVENPSTERLWPPVGDADERGPLNPPGLAPTSRRPLVNLTFALNRRLAGLDPRPYRVVNLALHVAAATLLAAVVRRTLVLPAFGGAWTKTAGPVALVAALVWAVHPLGTEAVAYVTQRTELMGALFYLLTLWAALRYWTARVDAARVAWMALATAACLAGVASKEIVASAPLVVLLYERTFIADSWRAVRRSWPLYAGLALSWLLLVLLNAGGVTGLSDPRHHVPIDVWWMTQTKVLFLYARLAVWPWPLSIHYASDFLRTFSAAWPWLAAAALLVVAIAAAVWRRPAARFVVVAVALVLAPTFVVPLPKMIAAERRMYLPLAGLVVLAVVGAYRLLTERAPHAGARLGAALAAAVVVAASAVSVARLGAYESAVTIWDDAVRHQPRDAMAHYNLGVALADAGRADDARTQFEEALRLDPEHTGALDNLGMLLNGRGRTTEAIGLFEKALTIEPGDAVAHNNLGAILTTTGRTDEAIRHLRLALAAQPDQPKGKVHMNLGNALLATGDVDHAIAHLEAAVRSDPDAGDAHYALGTALLRVGRADLATPELRAALRLRPDDAEATGSLAAALFQTGDADTAIAEYRHAIALAPDSPAAHNNLAATLLALHRPDEAIPELETVLRLRPDHANAHFNLGSALLDAGRPGEAITHFEQALRLDPHDAQARFQCAIAYARTADTVRATALANEALAAARSRGETALVDRIEAWLAAERAPSS